MNRNTCLITAFILFLNFSFAHAQETSTTKNSPGTEIVKLTKEEFEKNIYNLKEGEKAIYKGKIPCIIDFYADWCRPCRMLNPILEELLTEYNGKIRIYKINIDEQRALAQQFEVTSIPTLLLFPKKGRPAMIKGLPSKDELKSYIDQYLKP